VPLIMPADGRWDLTRRLKGYRTTDCFVTFRLPSAIPATSRSCLELPKTIATQGQNMDRILTVALVCRLTET
jgi:hypothetical protein